MYCKIEIILSSNSYLGLFCWAGMNDIASPMVILLENEADAYWCFEHAMRRLVCFKFMTFLL